MGIPAKWWEVAEVVFALSSLGEGDYGETLKTYRARLIKRGKANEIKAKEFDNAARGVKAAMAGQPETVASILVRARWMISQKMAPVFARPEGWAWGKSELEAIAEARLDGLEPVFLSYTKTGADPVPGPNTDEVRLNPWRAWIKTP